MRLLLAAALTLAAPAIAAPRAWQTVAAPAAEGSYLIGNPKARVKLVEYVSYTCPHCRHFSEASTPMLRDRFIASGSTSLEVRNLVFNKLDLAATVLARCAGPAAFARVHHALFAEQAQWVERGAAFDRANAARLAGKPPGEQLRALADGAGLTALATRSGMTAAAVTRCFADPAPLARTLAVAEAAGGRVTSTPSFELNGKLIERTDWAALEPMLRAAGAK